MGIVFSLPIFGWTLFSLCLIVLWGILGLALFDRKNRDNGIITVGMGALGLLMRIYAILPFIYINFRYSQSDINELEDNRDVLKQWEQICWPITIWYWNKRLVRYKAVLAEQRAKSNLETFYRTIKNTKKTRDSIAYIKMIARYYEIPDNVVLPILSQCRIGYDYQNKGKNYKKIQGFKGLIKKA